MGMIAKLSEIRLNRNIDRRLKLYARLRDLKAEHKEIREVLSKTGHPLKHIDEFFETKIKILNLKIEKLEEKFRKEIEKKGQKYIAGAEKIKPTKSQKLKEEESILEEKDSTL